MRDFWNGLFSVVLIIDAWRIYKKIGRQGWESLIPFYNIFVLFEELYGNGWQFLMLLIPIYNIYLLFRINIDIAHNFHKKTSFGVGIVLVPVVFSTMLAFGEAYWKDGSKANNDRDFFDNAADYVGNKMSGTSYNKTTADRLRELKRLYDEGILTFEEYETKRKDLIDKI